MKEFTRFMALILICLCSVNTYATNEKEKAKKDQYAEMDSVLGFTTEQAQAYRLILEKRSEFKKQLAVEPQDTELLSNLFKEIKDSQSKFEDILSEEQKEKLKLFDLSKVKNLKTGKTLKAETERVTSDNE